MALANYDDLKSAVADWLNRSDLTARIPDFIALAEARMRREVLSRNVTVNAAFSLNAASVALPADLKVLRAINRTTALYEGPIEIVSLDRIYDERRSYARSAVPRYAAVEGPNLVLAPTPDTTYTATIVYEPEVTPLATTSTNWWLTNHPDLYLYSALAESAPFLKDDERLAIWNGRYKDAVAQLEIARDRAEYGPTLIARPKRAL